MTPGWTHFIVLLGILSVLATGGAQTYSIRWRSAHPLRPVHFVKFGLLWERWDGGVERVFYPVNHNRPDVFEFEGDVAHRGARLLWCLAYYSEEDYFYIPVDEIFASAAGARGATPEGSDDDEEIIRVKVHCSGSRALILDSTYHSGQDLEDSCGINDYDDRDDICSDYGLSESCDSDDGLALP